MGLLYQEVPRKVVKKDLAVEYLRIDYDRFKRKQFQDANDATKEIQAGVEHEKYLKGLKNGQI